MINNTVEISKCTSKEDFESMKADFIDAINKLKEGFSVKIITDQEEDAYITCMTEIDTGDSGYGMYYGDVRFVNPESIVNFIAHCAGYTDVGSLGFGVEDISDSEVEITLITKDTYAH